MSFSSVRLSQLYKERADREAAFRESRGDLERTAREKLRPLNFIREHPGLFAGAAMSALSFLGLRKAPSFNGNGHSNGKRVSGVAGFLLRTLSLGGGIAAKTLQPVATTAIRFAIRTIFKKLRGR